MVGNFGPQTGSLQECSLPRSPMLVKCEILHKNGLLGATAVLSCICQPRPCFLNSIMIPLAISFTIRGPVGGRFFFFESIRLSPEGSLRL